MAKHIGKLVTVQGVVTRVTDVKPRIRVATYLATDEKAGSQREYYEVVAGRTFLPKTTPDQEMKAQGFVGNLTLMTRGSKFVKYQEIRIQELADKVPIGHIPRTMTVRVLGELTRTVRPGEEATLTGTDLSYIYIYIYPVHT